MLKLIFWALLAINAVLFAYGRGMLGSGQPGARDGTKIASQLNTDKLQLLSAAAADAARAQGPAAPSGAPALEPAPAAALLVACTEVGNFSSLDARRFDRLLAPLGLEPGQLSQQDVQAQEITSHMVMIPPLGSKQAADKKAAELKEQGVSNYFIINDTTAAKWAISLGVFKSEAAAQILLAALLKQGVTGAKIAGRSSSATRTVYRLRDIAAADKVKLDAIVARFEAIDMRSCT